MIYILVSDIRCKYEMASFDSNITPYILSLFHHLRNRFISKPVNFSVCGLPSEDSSHILLNHKPVDYIISFDSQDPENRPCLSSKL